MRVGVAMPVSMHACGRVYVCVCVRMRVGVAMSVPMHVCRRVYVCVCVCQKTEIKVERSSRQYQPTNSSYQHTYTKTAYVTSQPKSTTAGLPESPANLKAQRPAYLSHQPI